MDQIAFLYKSDNDDDIKTLVLQGVDRDNEWASQDIQNFKSELLPGYTVYIINRDSIPLIFREKLVKIVLETGTGKFRPQLQTFSENPRESINELHGNEKKLLLQYASNINFLLTETLGKGFNSRLKSDNPAESNIAKLYNYHLYFEDYELWTLPTYDIYEYIITEYSKYTGMIVCSSKTLLTEVPQKYQKDYFIDAVEFEPFDSTYIFKSDRTENVYLIAYPDIILFEDDIEFITTEILSRVKNKMDLKIFPRGTSSVDIKRLSLTKMYNGQWKPKDVFSNLDSSVFYRSIYHCATRTTNLTALFNGLYLLQSQDTWNYIFKEINIFLGVRTIDITYSGTYLPDYVRFKAAFRNLSVPESEFDQVLLKYIDNPENLKIEYEQFNKESIRFVHIFDYYKHMHVFLYREIPYQFNRPIKFLDDVNLVNINERYLIDKSLN